MSYVRLIPSTAWPRLREEAEQYEYFTLYTDHAKLVAPRLTEDGLPTVSRPRALRV